MSRTVRYLMYFLIFDAVVIGAYLGLKALRGGGSSALDAYSWVTIDENYQPKNDVESFIKNDAEVRGALPVFIKNYGHDAKALKRFKGKQFAEPSEHVLSLFFKGLDDWMLVEIKYQTGAEREVVRAVLYVFSEKQWKVGDTGTVLK
jgi:hypothetical protein